MARQLNILIKLQQFFNAPALFDKVTDRTALGTMSQSRSDFDYFIVDYSRIPEVDPVNATRWMNHQPLTARVTGYGLAGSCSNRSVQCRTLHDGLAPDTWD